MKNTENKDHLQELIGSDYELQWIIGHGGMSTVWLADDTRNDREVAIKVLRPEFSDNQEFLSRFRNEAESAESIQSDNVVATYDYRELEDNGRKFCFMALEYVRGESLADLLARENTLQEELALDVLEQAGHGLSIIHRMGLVHRDIKPGNLMITQNGQVKITDFGIAKAAASVPLTRTGMVVGTAQYVSPEQAQGKEVTPASDIYSLGVVGYEMLGGKRPFSGDSSVSIALAHINQEPEPLSTTISAPARELIRIALRKDPNTRYADGNEFTVAVSDVRLGKRPPQPKSIPPHQQAPEPSPSASTEMLADVAQPTTIHPAAGTAASAAAPQRKVAPAPDNDSKGGKSFLKGLGIVAAIALLAAVGYAIMNLMSSEGGDSEPSSTQETSVITEYRDPTTTQVETLEEEDTNETPQEVTVTETEPTDREGNQAPRDNHRQPQTPNQQAPTRNQQAPNTPTQQRQPQQRQPQETHVENTPEQKNTVNSQPDELPGDLSDLLRQDGD